MQPPILWNIQIFFNKFVEQAKCLKLKIKIIKSVGKIHLSPSYKATLIKDHTFFQARLQMHWDNRILLRCPPHSMRGHACYMFVCFDCVSCHFQQYFSYIVAVSFIGGGNWRTWRKPLTCHKSMTSFIT